MSSCASFLRDSSTCQNCYIWTPRASLVAQTVKNPWAMWEAWVQSLGWEDPLKSMTTHSSILAWRIPKDRGAWRATVHGVLKSWTHNWATKHSMLAHQILLTNDPRFSFICSHSVSSSLITIPTASIFLLLKSHSCHPQKKNPHHCIILTIFPSRVQVNIPECLFHL